MSAKAVNIRPAMPDDGAPLLALMHQHAEFEQASEPSITMDKLVSILSDASIIQFWLATLDSALVGYFSVTQNYSSWSGEPYLHLDCLFLHQDYRQQGIGGQLFTKVKSIAASLNLKQIQWQTPVENTNGIAFYVRQGASYKVKSRFTFTL